MKKTDFEALSRLLSTNDAPHLFSKNPTEFDKSYLKMSQWLNELCYFYIQKRKRYDKEIDMEFKTAVSQKKLQVSKLQTSEKKAGFLKALGNVKF